MREGGELADLGLRFDLTVPLARYYAENHARLPDPLKAIQIGPVWRAERPQKGRFRQFTQCDIDIARAVALGGRGGRADPGHRARRSTALGLTDLTVRINDRRLLGPDRRHCGFEESVQAGFFIAFDKLDKLGPEGVLGRAAPGRPSPGAAVDRFARLLPTLQKGELSLEALRTAAGGRRGGRGVRVARVDHRRRRRRDAGRQPGAVRSHAGARHGVLHRDDLRDQRRRPFLVDRGRGALRPDDRQAARAGRPRLRVLHRLRAADHDPGRARRGARPPSRRPRRRGGSPCSSTRTATSPRPWPAPASSGRPGRSRVAGAQAQERRQAARRSRDARVLGLRGRARAPGRSP